MAFVQIDRDICLVLKDSDMESENLSLLIPLSVSDGQKTRQFKDCIIYKYIIKMLIVSFFLIGQLLLKFYINQYFLEVYTFITFNQTQESSY